MSVLKIGEMQVLHDCSLFGCKIIPFTCFVSQNFERKKLQNSGILLLLLAGESSSYIAPHCLFGTSRLNRKNQRLSSYSASSLCRMKLANDQVTIWHSNSPSKYFEFTSILFADKKPAERRKRQQYW